MNIALAVEIAVALCQRWEGFYAKPYLCPAGVPTCGFGTTYYEDGSRVSLTDAPITRDRATGLLVGQLKTIYLPQVIKLCPSIDTPERLAAILDFTYNLGGSALARSNLRKKINAGNWDAVPSELAKWNKAGGVVLKGLVLRREAEASLVS